MTPVILPDHIVQILERAEARPGGPPASMAADHRVLADFVRNSANALDHLYQASQSRPSEARLAEMFDDLREGEPLVGSFYSHYKDGAVYQVTAKGMLESLMRPAVLYTSCLDQRPWIRSVENFLSVLATDDDRRVHRFQFRGYGPGKGA